MLSPNHRQRRCRARNLRPRDRHGARGGDLPAAHDLRCDFLRAGRVRDALDRQLVDALGCLDRQRGDQPDLLSEDLLHRQPGRGCLDLSVQQAPHLGTACPPDVTILARYIGNHPLRHRVRPRRDDQRVAPQMVQQRRGLLRRCRRVGPNQFADMGGDLTKPRAVEPFRLRRLLMASLSRHPVQEPDPPPLLPLPQPGRVRGQIHSHPRQFRP